eukprot:403364636
MDSDLVPKKGLDKSRINYKKSTHKLEQMETLSPYHKNRNKQTKLIKVRDSNDSQFKVFQDSQTQNKLSSCFSGQKSNNVQSQFDSNSTTQRKVFGQGCGISGNGGPGLSQSSKMSSFNSSSSKRDSFRNKLRGMGPGLVIKQSLNSMNTYDSQQIQVVKLNGQGNDQFFNEQSLYRSAFHLQYDEGEFLGEGLAATVSKCINKKSGETFAVKIMRTDDEEKLMAAQNEYAIQKELKHTNIIEVKEMFFENMRNTIYTVMEFFDGQQLEDYVNKNGPIKNFQKRTDSLTGKTNFNVKICDFNVAKNFKHKSLMTMTGLEQWQAPEMKGGSKYTEKVDLWSVGCVLFFMITGYPPFSTHNIAKMHESIELGTFQFINEDAEESLNSNLIINDLIRKLIVADPLVRISAEEALKHMLFQASHKKVPPNQNVKSSVSAQNSEAKISASKLDIPSPSTMPYHESPQPKKSNHYLQTYKPSKFHNKRAKPKERHDPIVTTGGLITIDRLSQNNNDQFGPDYLNNERMDSQDQDNSPHYTVRPSLRIKQINSFLFRPDEKDGISSNAAHLMRTFSKYQEYIQLGSSFFQCCLLFLSGPMEIELELLVFFFTLFTYLISWYYRGIRIHLWPVVTGFSFYTFTLIFPIMVDLSHFYYYLTCLISLMIVYFFGSVENYQGFVTSGRYQVGCKETQTKVSGNRVLIYYPVDKKLNRQNFKDMLWAYDGENMIKGLMKFGADIVPATPFYHLQSVKQRVMVDAPLVKLPDSDKHEGKNIPIVFSHGVGNTMTWFSTMCKDFASQGFVVYAIEHNDGSALHHYNDQKQHKYYKQFDMRDQNKIVQKIGIRQKELSNLLDELVHISKNQLGEEVKIDMDQLTVVGHGLGATTAIVFAAKDDRVKKVISLDPWLTPIKDEIDQGLIKVQQPHCTITSDIFQGNVEKNWQLTNSFFQGKVDNKNNILSLLNNIGHMAFTDLPLILQLELRIIMFTPSFAHIFRAQDTLRLILGVTKAFFIKNGMSKESGNYEELIKRLESTKDVTFEVK